MPTKTDRELQAELRGLQVENLMMIVEAEDLDARIAENNAEIARIEREMGLIG